MGDVPDGWEEWPPAPPLIRWFARTFPDGVDVYVQIRRTPAGRFAVSSSAEHRCSGPVEAPAGEFETLPEATAVAVRVCRSYDAEQA